MRNINKIAACACLSVYLSVLSVCRGMHVDRTPNKGNSNKDQQKCQPNPNPKASCSIDNCVSPAVSTYAKTKPVQEINPLSFLHASSYVKTKCAQKEDRPDLGTDLEDILVVIIKYNNIPWPRHNLIN